MAVDETGVHLKLFTTMLQQDVAVKVNNGFWHHLGITWTSVSGAWSVYLDGVMSSQGNGHGDGILLNVL